MNKLREIKFKGLERGSIDTGATSEDSKQSQQKEVPMSNDQLKKDLEFAN